MRSLPPAPQMTSRPEVPVSVSDLAVPVTVQCTASSRVPLIRWLPAIRSGRLSPVTSPTPASGAVGSKKSSSSWEGKKVTPALPSAASLTGLVLFLPKAIAEGMAMSSRPSPSRSPA
jgi:hypothetical protein